MERLTPAEEQVMLKLWKLEKASVHQILELYAEPKPAYNTTSTIVRILEKKKFIKHKPQGKGFIYYPRISMIQYREYLADYLLKNYFEGDRKAIVSHFNKSSLNELL
ncbi:MAG: CopY family transcriptional repressor [Crocinitomicaceae bacterium]|jgi:predicted transcriptional regulator|nr:CopY family transcriptional repressor [Crocinitomicaceae bacterium]